MSRYWDIKRKSQSPEPKPSTEKRNNKSSNFLYFIILILIIFIIFSSSSLFSNKNQSNANPDSSSKIESPDSSVDKPSSNPTTDKNDNSLNLNSENDKENIKILNGSGISGVATAAKEKLVNQGYFVSNIGNSSKLYDNSIIYYKSGSDETSKLVAEVLKEYKFTTENNEEMTEDASILVIIGKNQ